MNSWKFMKLFMIHSSFSYLSVSGIQSHDMIEVDVIDFVSCLGLESLIDQVVFTVGYP